ncbi:MAG: FliH/SctL family protein [Planctomycetota bacterium]|nr:FliH/SctL family protein [Planctomycetota bacterium]
MNRPQIQLKRSPRRVTVADKSALVNDMPRAKPSPPALSHPASSQRPKSTTVANVIANPVDRSVTPLSRSSAVPMLSNTAQAVVKAEEVGLGGIDPEDISRLQQLLADTAESVSELQIQHRQSLEEMQEVAVELAAAAASWLVGVAIEKDMFAIDDLILKSFEHLELNQSVKVRLNPADYDLLQTLLTDPASREQLDQVSCVKDETISRGAVRVGSGRRILLTDMDTRLEEVRRSWMEKLNDSQIERRGDGSASRTLRRFPERRETA